MKKNEHFIIFVLLVGVLLFGMFNLRGILFEVQYQIERGKFERKLSLHFEELPNGAPLLPLEIDGWKLARICGDCGGFESPPTHVCSNELRSQLDESEYTRKSPGDNFWMFYKGCQMPMLLNGGERVPWFDIPRLPTGEVWIYTTPPKPKKKQCVYQYPSDLLSSIERNRKVIGDCGGAD